MYIELPPECHAPSGHCGKLSFWLYGFRKAAVQWEQHYAAQLEEVGFVRGLGCSVLFFHQERDIALAVHGDDFIATGRDADVEWFCEYIRKCFEVKVRAVLGEGDHYDKEVVMLGRTVKWVDGKGVDIVADEKHRRTILEYFGFDGKTSALTDNGELQKVHDEGDLGERLSSAGATAYRALVARLNFLGQDSPDLQFPAKELSRDMACPTVGSWGRLKKVARFLVGRRCVVWHYRFQHVPSRLSVFVDSDWGGDRLSRKSTSGGAICLGGHLLRTWSSTQSAIALSSAEAEFYALVDGALRAKWAQTVLSELGWTESPVAEVASPAFELLTDSSAARSFVSRRGLGKMRHLEIRDLWLQREVGQGKVIVSKVLGTENPADTMTKFMPWHAIASRLARVNVSFDWVSG